MHITVNAKINATKPTVEFSNDVDLFIKVSKSFTLDRDGKVCDELGLYMEAVSIALFDPKNWKAPFVALRPECDLAWVKVAAHWYFGNCTFERVLSDDVVTGYQCNGYAAY